jgi:uncharacterized protein
VEGRVAWINIAPVKGLRLVDRDAVELTDKGADHDRRFHLIDDHGVMVNGKRLGRLVAVEPAYDGETLRLAFPDGDVVEGPVETGDEISSVFFGRPRPGRLVLGPFSEALTDYAGPRLRLVRADGAAVDRGRGGGVSMLSRAACGDHDPRRFRMLFGVDGIPAHAEDDWVGYRVRIGDAVVRPTGHTGRCLITSQDPDTGIADMDMLGVIRETRPDDTSEPLPFGVHGSVAQPGTVRVGDPVARI